ncbi:hypothetical protein NDI79_14650 [Halogeometricum sp. S3BR5-2]|uniref:Uncharacterized protein n=1 Tax=Halogeometricum luteum TaxID=2950537 RepID=A0ABU2G537_9EURY|nr:hypothetical protein [Halogeometricum sp. S3BR5-2]MDS0295408.1 hypothetical protein [Halogeometricum sp. S3BR5-2]
MPSIIDKTVFGEPSRSLALVYLCGALLMAGQQGYYVIVKWATPFYAVLFLIAGIALSSIAESLPNLDDVQPASCGSQHSSCW